MNVDLLLKFPLKNYCSYKFRRLINSNDISSPENYKRWLIAYYARKYQVDTLVETGTAFGETLSALQTYFKSLHSIELDETLYFNANLKFKNHSHVHCHFGDSEFVLTKILSQISQQCIFWLDAHEMVGGAKGNKTTPIIEELHSIFNHQRDDHIIIIDDVRMFDKGSYPSIKEIKMLSYDKWPTANISIKNDIIRINNI